MANEALKKAVKGGKQKGGGNPFAAFPEVNKLYEASYQLPLSNAQVGVSGYNAGVDVANRQAAEAAAREQKKAELQERAQKLEDMTDPSKYQQIRDKSGGYQFLDPTGEAISAQEYADITGQDLGNILADSQNPIDIGFNEDWKNLQEYLTAKVNSKNDQEALTRAQQIEKTVRDSQGVDLATMDIQEVIERFRQAYPTVFGRTNTGVRAGTTFLPTASGAEFSGGAIGS